MHLKFSRRSKLVACFAYLLLLIAFPAAVCQPSTAGTPTPCYPLCDSQAGVISVGKVQNVQKAFGLPGNGPLFIKGVLSGDTQYLVIVAMPQGSLPADNTSSTLLLKVSNPPFTPQIGAYISFVATPDPQNPGKQIFLASNIGQASADQFNNQLIIYHGQAVESVTCTPNCADKQIVFRMNGLTFHFLLDPETLISNPDASQSIQAGQMVEVSVQFHGSNPPVVIEVRILSTATAATPVAPVINPKFSLSLADVQCSSPSYTLPPFTLIVDNSGSNVDVQWTASAREQNPSQTGPWWFGSSMTRTTMQGQKDALLITPASDLCSIPVNSSSVYHMDISYEGVHKVLGTITLTYTVHGERLT